jgi:hypothetical protein
MALNLSRNAELWVSTVTTGFSTTNTFKIPLLDGYSFGQTQSSTDIAPEEAGAAPTRGSKRFIDALDPAEWSFSTYIRPFVQESVCTTPDAIMWAGLASNTHSSFAASPVVAGASSLDIDFTSNAVHELLKLNLFFRVDNSVFLISGCQVNQAEISVDINDIGMVAWSGQGLKRTRLSGAELTDFNTNLNDATKGSYFGDATSGMTYVKMPETEVSNFIKNKLSTMAITYDIDGAATAYDTTKIPLTAASLTISNNISFLTPSTLSTVDIPIGSFTGTLEVTGSVTAYLNDGTGKSLALFESILNDADKVNSKSSITINVGGTSGYHAVLSIPTAQVSLPDIGIEDIVSMTMEFKGIPSSDDLNTGDEVSVSIKAS